MRDLLGVSNLPEGPPLERGVSLDPSLPGTSTFVYPAELDTNWTAPSQSIYRTETPQDLGKRQQGDDSIDHSQAKPSFYGLGPKDPNDHNLIKSPYSDDKPTPKTATTLILAYSYLAGLQKTASTMSEIISGVNPKIQTRSKRMSVHVKRADPTNLRWIFSVKSDSGKSYTVKLKATRPKNNITRLINMDLDLSCNCPAWKWQGPEYHARYDYLLNVPRGTATFPEVRDPKGENTVCKHVLAALRVASKWNIKPKERIL